MCEHIWTPLDPLGETERPASHPIVGVCHDEGCGRAGLSESFETDRSASRSLNMLTSCSRLSKPRNIAFASGMDMFSGTLVAIARMRNGCASRASTYRAKAGFSVGHCKAFVVPAAERAAINSG